ncbi:MAG TPA: co-chaperone GroES [Pirellulales bacterium]|nr:co-chaperone GroES [Pirellulales bacterium]
MKLATIQPLNDFLLVRPMSAEPTRTDGGIELPDTSKDGPICGEILSCGPGRFQNGALRPMGVAVSDRILFDRFAGREIRVEGSYLRIIREYDVLAKY